MLPGARLRAHGFGVADERRSAGRRAAREHVRGRLAADRSRRSHGIRPLVRTGSTLADDRLTLRTAVLREIPAQRVTHNRLAWEWDRFPVYREHQWVGRDSSSSPVWGTGVGVMGAAMVGAGIIGWAIVVEPR
ncbi:MAG: hypothetical protein D6725_03855 [Planctomycetota bacterium]|nr:MAG: hypothetical protein D6725_03855 [Planctomycetota bacterium]